MRNDELNNSLIDQSNLINIDKNSEEGNYISFLVKSSIQIYSNMSISTIISLSNENTKGKFNNISENKLSLYCWSYANNPDSNLLVRLKNFGFEISSAGMDFFHGCVDETKYDIELEKLNSIIISKVVVGRSYVKLLDKTDFLINENTYKKEIGSNYDSCLIITKNDRDQNDQVKYFKYRIFESEKVLPLYYITFNTNFTKEKDYNLSLRICNECNDGEEFTSYAKYFCVNCDLFLCEECKSGKKESGSFDFHEKHKFIIIEKNLPGKCTCDGYESVIEYYCEDCSKGLCGNCKITGPHSKGLSKDHRVVTISEVYSNKNIEKWKFVDEISKKFDELVKSSLVIFENIEKLNDNKDKLIKQKLSSIVNSMKDYTTKRINEIYSKMITKIHFLRLMKFLIDWIGESLKNREGYMKDKGKLKFEYLITICLYIYYMRKIVNMKISDSYLYDQLNTLIEKDFIDPNPKKIFVVKMEFKDFDYEDEEQGWRNNEKRSKLILSSRKPRKTIQLNLNNEYSQLLHVKNENKVGENVN